MARKLTLPEFLKEYRQARGLEQGDLARELGTTQQTISNWESGKSTPRASAEEAIHKLVRKHSQATKQSIYVVRSYPDAIEELPDPVDKIESPRRARLIPAPGASMGSAVRVQINEILKQNESRVEFDVGVRFATGALRVHFLSPGICVEVVSVDRPGQSPLVIRSLFKLLTVRKLLGYNVESPRRCALILYHENASAPEYQRQVRYAAALGAIHGIDVVTSHSVYECSQIIEALDKNIWRTPDLFDDEFDDGESDT